MLVTWVWTGSAYVLPSTMAKTAVHAMTMSLAVEWGRHNIRVNAVAPGPFPTESAWEKLAPIPKANVGAASADEVPMGRFGRMHEFCNLLTFLQADGCDYLTGQNIAIDGGHHLAAPSTFAALGKLSPDDGPRPRRWCAAGRSRRRRRAAPAETGGRRSGTGLPPRVSDAEPRLLPRMMNSGLGQIAPCLGHHRENCPRPSPGHHNSVSATAAHFGGGAGASEIEFK